MMDINGLSSLAHKLEDLFSYYRENMDKLEHPEPDLFDLLFAASDFIAQELEQMNREDYAPGDTSVLEQMTDDFLGHVSREEEKDSGKGGKTQGEEEGKEELPVIPELFVSKSGTVVNVTLEEGCRMENIRAFMLVRSITGLCTLVETYPENLEKQGESAQYIEGHGVFIRFESGDKEKVLETLRKGLLWHSAGYWLTASLRIRLRLPRRRRLSGKIQIPGKANLWRFGQSVWTICKTWLQSFCCRCRCWKMNLNGMGWRI